MKTDDLGGELFSETSTSFIAAQNDGNPAKPRIFVMSVSFKSPGRH